ncbi:MAG: L-serine ammonia-lyase [Clostridia bacterium]|nr:L-serine ammonia-lyase [Clostridia bacterium]
MQSLKELYRIGKGPSSSHTIAPERACKFFLKENPTADAFKVILYGSLAKTGIGHGTKEVVKSVLANVEIVEAEEEISAHPNTMDLIAYQNGKEIAEMRVYSVGGGAFRVEGRENTEGASVYPLSTFTEIKQYCEEKSVRLPDYVLECEGEQILSYLKKVWSKMQSSIEEGLHANGVLPGGLQVERKAGVLYGGGDLFEKAETRENRIVCAYAFAVSEQNASNGTIVTAPTCGASGVLPAVLKYLQGRDKYSEEDIVRALATAGLIGNLIKKNASISGAECGCQAEIGSACCMAAAAICELKGMSLDQIEYAAEVAMEHHLGLTCDPIMGLVQIPCIERNAVAAMRAINAANLAEFLSGSRKISFDMVVKTMYETGKDLSNRYRETAEGGLAKLYK